MYGHFLSNKKTEIDVAKFIITIAMFMEIGAVVFLGFTFVVTGLVLCTVSLCFEEILRSHYSTTSSLTCGVNDDHTATAPITSDDSWIELIVYFGLGTLIVYYLLL